jgi:putative colanic acid biosynthesis glycosyltransferase
MIKPCNQCLEVVTVCKKPGESIQSTFLSLLPHLRLGLIRWHIVDSGLYDDYLNQISQICLVERLDVKISYGFNDGIYPAMNYGIKECSSTHILFINSGDTLNLSDIRPLLDTIYQDHSTVYLFGHYIRDVCPALRFFKNIQYNLFKYSSIALPTSHNSIIYPTNALKRFPFDEHFTCAADFEQFLAIKSSKLFSFVYHNLILTVVSRAGFIANNKQTSFKQHISILSVYKRPLPCAFWRFRLAIHF